MCILHSHQNYKRDANASPYPKHRRSKREGSSSPSKSSSSSRSHTSSNGVPAVDKFGEARNVLQSVMAQRHNLESNLELMLRSRQDVDVYALLEPGASRWVSGVSRWLSAYTVSAHHDLTGKFGINLFCCWPHWQGITVNYLQMVSALKPFIRIHVACYSWRYLHKFYLETCFSTFWNIFEQG